MAQPIHGKQPHIIMPCQQNRGIAQRNTQFCGTKPLGYVSGSLPCADSHGMGHLRYLVRAGDCTRVDSWCGCGRRSRPQCSVVLGRARRARVSCPLGLAARPSSWPGCSGCSLGGGGSALRTPSPLRDNTIDTHLSHP